jgi:ABC-type lipoprotein export system ATPase subunit
VGTLGLDRLASLGQLLVLDPDLLLGDSQLLQGHRQQRLAIHRLLGTELELVAAGERTAASS